ncbi:peptidase M23 [Phaeobacter sp. LSS9]|uniref:peptidase M23 n=1 Tax=unclassified Phaeobacter TaxID=2621772 RepID=UPI0013C2D829|nr:peptidase M23 [Phaeobacter sp. LSS9]
MTPRPAFFTLLLLIGSPALAHGGAHIHPHGAETWLLAALVATVVIGCASLLWRRK